MSDNNILKAYRRFEELRKQLFGAGYVFVWRGRPTDYSKYLADLPEYNEEIDLSHLYRKILDDKD